MPTLRRAAAYPETQLAGSHMGFFDLGADFLHTRQPASRDEYHDSTIIGGVVEFAEAGAWDIASIIFIASIGVPAIKFAALLLLLITCQRQSRWACRERCKLFRFVETVGYWSMLDVIVVALVAALVKFEALANIEPRAGILFFGMVVVLTMLAAMSFDPRLIWQATRPEEVRDGA